MKIRVDRNRIIKAVKDLEGVEIVVENADDAREAIDLILNKIDLFKAGQYARPKDLLVTAFQEYTTSAVDYNIVFVLEFIFEDGIPLNSKVAAIKAFQDFFAEL